MDLISLRGFVHDFADADDVPNPIQPKQDCTCLLLGVGGDGCSCCCGATASDDTDGRGEVLDGVGDFVDLHACIYDCMMVSGLR